MIYNQTPTSQKIYYIYTDYLGSLRCITDADGNVEQHLSYDAWGYRRDPVSGEKLSSSAIGGMMFARGFTGHEHMDEFGLINMNGRVYDPALGIFLSPDNYVQAPDFTQNYNRYTYCLNNPLMFTDPSGEFAFIPILVGMAYGALIGAGTSAIAYTVATVATGNQWDWGSFGKSVAFGAVGGAIGGGLGALGATGSLGSFGNSLGYNIIRQTSSTIVTNTIFGHDITLGNLAGSLVGGFIGASMPGFTGIQGSAFKNAISEIGYNTFKGAFTGAYAGAVSGLIDDNPNGMVEGMIGGAIQGASSTIFMNLAFGAPFKPTKSYGNVGNNAPVYRRGGLLMMKESGVTLGRNVCVKPTGNPVEDDFLYTHETAHVIQQQQMGFANFYGRTATEYISNYTSGLGVLQVYAVPGTLEYQANYMTFQRLGYYFNIFGAQRTTWP